MGHFDGFMCQWWWLLPLFVRCGRLSFPFESNGAILLSVRMIVGSRMRSYYSRRYLRPWLPTKCRSVALWRSSIAAKDQAIRHFTKMVSQIRSTPTNVFSQYISIIFPFTLFSSSFCLTAPVIFVFFLILKSECK